MKIDKSKVNLLEKDIEDHLFENPHLVECGGYKVSKWVKRQYRVPSGIVDLIGVTDAYDLVIVEVKNVALDASALTQVSRYAYDVYNIMLNMEKSTEHDDTSRPRIYRLVVGPSIDEKTMLEAESIGVRFILFEVRFELDLSTYSWTREYENNRLAQYLEQKDDIDLVGIMEMREGYLNTDYDTIDTESAEIISEIEQELSEAE